MSGISDAVLAHLQSVVQVAGLDGFRFEVGEELGRGGMGIVYRAHDRELERPVALKVLNSSPSAAPTESRLVQEARIIARLEHPGIVPVHDAGRLPDGRLYYAMKLVRGRRLDEPGDRSTTLAERLRIFLKICDAIAFAHANGVLHRDLKPQNIMIGPFGEVLVMDWGVAKAVGGPAPNTDVGGAGVGTAHGTIVGTPGYMAPEQARGDVSATDERADVYGLGAILYFLLTNRAPDREGLSITRPRQFERSMPRPLEAICLRALASEPAGRYGRAADLANDITRFLGGQRVGAYPESPVESVWRLGVRYRAALALILAYLLMRILLLIFARP